MRAAHLLPVLAFISQIPPSNTPNDFVAKLMCGYGTMGISIHTCDMVQQFEMNRCHFEIVWDTAYAGFPHSVVDSVGNGYRTLTFFLVQTTCHIDVSIPAPQIQLL